MISKIDFVFMVVLKDEGSTNIQKIAIINQDLCFYLSSGVKLFQGHSIANGELLPQDRDLLLQGI